MKKILLAASTLSLSGCLNNNSPSECQSTQVVPVSSAIGPKTVAVNQPATYSLTYQPGSACGKLSSVAEQVPIAANTHLLGVQVDYNGCNCPQTTTLAQALYTFVPTQPGTYYFRFVTASGYLTDTLVAK